MAIQLSKQIQSTPQEFEVKLQAKLLEFVKTLKLEVPVPLEATAEEIKLQVTAHIQFEVGSAVFTADINYPPEPNTKGFI
jgi:hypothetical protein